MSKVQCEGCGGWFQARKDGLPRGHSGEYGSYCRSPRADVPSCVVTIRGNQYVPIETYRRFEDALLNEAMAAAEARKIARGWRETAIRYGYRDDEAAGTVDPCMDEI